MLNFNFSFFFIKNDPVSKNNVYGLLTNSKKKLNTNKLSFLQKMKDPILYISVLLALGAIFTANSLFKNDDDDYYGYGDNFLTFQAFEFLKQD